MNSAIEEAIGKYLPILEEKRLGLLKICKKQLSIGIAIILATWIVNLFLKIPGL